MHSSSVSMSTCGSQQGTPAMALIESKAQKTKCPCPRRTGHSEEAHAHSTLPLFQMKFQANRKDQLIPLYVCWKIISMASGWEIEAETENYHAFFWQNTITSATISSPTLWGVTGHCCYRWCTVCMLFETEQIAKVCFHSGLLPAKEVQVLPRKGSLLNWQEPKSYCSPSHFKGRKPFFPLP